MTKKVSAASSSCWARIALSIASEITDASPGRGSATPAEARAAGTVRQRLVSLGVRDIWQQTFWGLRSIWLFFALAFGIALVGHAAYWLLRGPAGWQVALPVSLAAFSLSAFLLWRKLTFGDYPLRQSLPHGESQNLVAVLPAALETKHQVVLVAHLDSHRAVWAFASENLLRLGKLLVPLAIYGVLVAPLLYLLAQFTQLTIFAWAALPLALAHFTAWFTGVTADLGPYSPGANDNASAVGTILALAERLQHEPLKHTEIWLAFTGCEESGCDGMQALLKEHGAALKDALFVDFELVGIGERLGYLQSEGILRRQIIPQQVESLVQEVGQEFGGLFPLQAAAFGAFTENGILLERGFCSLCLLVLRQDSTLLPEWHRLTDRSERLQIEALDLAHRFAWALLQRLDSEAVNSHED
jgi:hypothetical protein